MEKAGIFLSSYPVSMKFPESCNYIFVQYINSKCALGNLLFVVLKKCIMRVAVNVTNVTDCFVFVCILTRLEANLVIRK